MIVAFEKDSVNLCLQEIGQEEDNRPAQWKKVADANVANSSRQREHSKTRRFIRNCPKQTKEQYGKWFAEIENTFLTGRGKILRLAL